MQKLLILLVLALFSSVTFAQDIDELKSKVEKIEDQDVKAEMLNKLGVMCRDANLLDDAIDYHFQALDIYEAINDKNGQALALYYIGGIYWRKNDFEQALHYYTLALQLREQEDDVAEKAKILNNMGLASRSLGDYETALEYYYRALGCWIQKDNKKEIATTLNHIGNVFLNKNDADSALTYYNKALSIRRNMGDTVSIATTLSNMATLYKNQNDFATAVSYLKQSIDLLEAVNDKSRLGDSYNILGGIYWQNKEYQQALFNYLKALEIREEEGDKNQIAATMNNIGLIYKDLGNFDKALEYYEKTLVQYQAMDDRFQESNALNFIGGVYWQKGDFGKARDNYLRSLALRRVVGDKSYEARSHNNLALVYKSMGERDSSLMEYQAALSLYKEIGDEKNVASLLNNIGNLFIKFDEIEGAMQYFNIALSMRKEIGDLSGEAYSSLDLGNAYIQKRMENTAIPLFERAYQIAKEMENIDLEKDVLFAFSQVYEKRGDFTKAYKYFTAYTSLKDQILSTETIKKIADMQIRYETEKKEKELQVKESLLFQQTEKNKRLYNLIVFVIVLLGSISTAVIFIARQNQKIKKANELLEQQKQKITDSIEYASRIQNAVLPPERIQKEVLTNHFVMFRPRDIVSGDFYWMTRVKNYSVVAAVDCTGHGVPGAFMSMLGATLFNEVVNKTEWKTAADILNAVREQIKLALHQTDDESSTSDGMDCALCVIDYEAGKMQFAGAHNPLYQIRNKELTEFEGDRMPLGVYMLQESPFNYTEIDIQKGDCYYIFSDGYCDQFGGSKGRKFFTRNLKQLLVDVNPLDLQEQKLKIEQTFDDWKGEHRQIDDVVVVGFKI